jgi:hypothetical protein
MKRADLNGRNTARKGRRTKREIAEMLYAQQAHKWQDWKENSRAHVLRTAAHLRREARHAWARREYQESDSLAFASRMIEDALTYGRPGLLVGMFYSENWQYLPAIAGESLTDHLQESEAK